VNVGPAAGTALPTAAGQGSSRNGCAVVRNDDSSGALDDATSATAFDGTLGYRFAPQGSSDCSDLLLEGGFATLPCSMSYRMSGAWVSAR
jgi:hypothetical protein